jgi:hypothetical protein
MPRQRPQANGTPSSGLPPFINPPSSPPQPPQTNLTPPSIANANSPFTNTPFQFFFSNLGPGQQSAVLAALSNSPLLNSSPFLQQLFLLSQLQSLGINPFRNPFLTANATGNFGPLLSLLQLAQLQNTGLVNVNPLLNSFLLASILGSNSPFATITGNSQLQTTGFGFNSLNSTMTSTNPFLNSTFGTTGTGNMSPLTMAAMARMQNSAMGMNALLNANLAGNASGVLSSLLSGVGGQNSLLGLNSLASSGLNAAGAYGGGSNYSPSAAQPSYNSAASTMTTNQSTLGQLTTLSEPAATNNGMDTIFAGLGLAARDGHLKWPLALDALPPAEETATLRKQVESLLTVMAHNTSSNVNNKRFGDEARRAVAHLQSLTYSHRYSMTAGTYKDAERFLANLDNALKVLQ